MRKTCNGCGRVAAFYRDAGRRDGLDAVCKRCRSEQAKAYRQANRARNTAAAQT